jgi:hypothetical protein
MRTITLALATMLGLLVGTSARANLTLDIANNAGGNIAFTGTTTPAGAQFVFNAGTNGHAFNITGSTGTGSAVGLNGDISGTYSYHTSGIVVNGSTQTAPVSGTGTFSIIDASSHTLTATVSFVNISTFMSAGVLNGSEVVNLSGFSYTGTNADLVQLKNVGAANNGIATVTFQFVPAQSLTTLTSGTHSTSYSGNVATTAVPEPAPIALACCGLPVLGLLWARRRRQQA